VGGGCAYQSVKKNRAKDPRVLENERRPESRRTESYQKGEVAVYLKKGKRR